MITCPHCARKFHPIKNKVNQKYAKHCSTCVFNTANTATRYTMPPKNKSILSFTNYKYTHPYRFAIYADFETLNKPIPCLCILCTELYNNVVGLHKKDEIIQKCKIRNHKIYTFSNCIKCTQMFLLIKKKFSRGCKKSNHKITYLTSNMCE